MKILLFSRRRMPFTADELYALRDNLQFFGFDYAINREFAALFAELGIPIAPQQIYDREVGEEPEGTIMICYGGDGTLLEGVHRLGGAPIPVMGINAGHLGFLTTAPSNGLHAIFEQIVRGDLTVEPRSMLEVSGDFAESPDTVTALNEFTVQRRGAGMVSVETLVDGQAVATCHGDGIIVSTPTGSTAYSLSAGGPIVAPACSCFIISPLAPHNLTMRPLVIPDSSVITLKVHARRSEAFVTLDNRACDTSREAEFRIKCAAQKIFLAVPHNISFYDTLRNKMMWGVDIRS